MALKGLDIFKLTPKTNCKDCGLPTCMAFSMKVAQGAIPIEKCPHLSDEAISKLSEATAPPMRTVKIGDYELGGETVLARHDKTFVNRPLFAVSVCNARDDEHNARVLGNIDKIDYERIGERMYIEFLYVNYVPGKGDDRFIDLMKKAVSCKQDLIISCKNAELLKEAVKIAEGKNFILNSADADNFEEMAAIAKEAGAPLCVSGKDISELYDTVEAVEKLGFNNIIINVSAKTVKETFANAVLVRRAALKNKDRVFGYPSIVNIARLAPDNPRMQSALASLFTLKYGSVLVLDDMDYSQALPLYGLRQNIFTDPQKPMRVEPGIYPLNNADENSVCLTTVDFALTYFVVSGEIERSGVPANLLISDAGGYSVLTAWAAGKLSASSIEKFVKEHEIEDKIKNRTLILPGKVAVLKGEIEERLPGWNIVVGTNEAIELVRFLRERENT
jgi:acetyl-CoA decarbonylase/synthase complex subunit gamma